jgi:ATP-dependent helicase HrpB
MPIALPIDEVIPEIRQAVARSGQLVLEAPPGAGKTTRVPVALLEIVPAGSRVLVMEPRRLAARLSAKRVADERGEKPGHTIGYEVRFERAIGPETRVEYLTEGILQRRLLDDASLRGVGAVVLDEFHERHLQGDVALALLRRLRATSRPDLALVVMSATLDAEPIARALGAERLRSEGRRFEVAIEHAPNDARAGGMTDRPLAAQVAAAVRRIAREEPDGDMLVFLPGAGEIRRAMEACEPIAREHALVLLPLHGDLPMAAQELAIAKGERRKVVFSTNVAETSVTIEGIVAVIDTGLARVAGHDPWSGRPTLQVAKVSRASATQRAGRAGRVRPGRALRLYTKGDFEARPEQDLPEILRADLAETTLQLLATGEPDVAAMPWLDPPPRAALEAAELLLQRLELLERRDPASASTRPRISALGRRAAMLPLPPRLGRMLLEAADRGALAEGAKAAAILAEGRDLYARSLEGRRVTHDDAPSDLLARLDDLDAVSDGRGGVDHHRARNYGVDAGVAAGMLRVARQLERALARDPRCAQRHDVDPAHVIGLATLAAFPDRVAMRRGGAEGRLGASRELVLSAGGTATLDEASVVKTSPWLVAIDALSVAGRTRVTLASAIEPDWLIEIFPERIVESVDVRWNADASRVEATERMLYDRLLLDERPAGKGAEEAVAALLAEKSWDAGDAAFAEGDRDRVEALAARVEFVRRTAPDLADAAGLGPLDVEAIRAIQRARCRGLRSFAQLRGAGSLAEAVRVELGFAASRALDELAPEHVVIGAGRKTRVSYPHDAPPSIASHLQDFFGTTETPRVLRGRVPLVLHLLAPNGRDVQITTDLAGFWARHYPSVRSELARKYPRRSWPDDPRTAAPPEPRPRRR